MNPTNHPFDHASAHDALFDQIERELAALTIAPLDGHDVHPRHCVDEFANEFMNWSMPPLARPRPAPASRRTSTRSAG